jgi:hypothetical protein
MIRFCFHGWHYLAEARDQRDARAYSGNSCDDRRLSAYVRQFARLALDRFGECAGLDPRSGPEQQLSDCLRLSGNRRAAALAYRQSEKLSHAYQLRDGSELASLVDGQARLHWPKKPPTGDGAARLRALASSLDLRPFPTAATASDSSGIISEGFFFRRQTGPSSPGRRAPITIRWAAREGRLVATEIHVGEFAPEPHECKRPPTPRDGKNDCTP